MIITPFISEEMIVFVGARLSETDAPEFESWKEESLGRSELEQRGLFPLGYLSE